MVNKNKYETLQCRNTSPKNRSTLQIGPINNIPDITQSELGEIAAWYLGPRGENSQLFQDMIIQAIQETVAYRRNFEPSDPHVITDKIKSTEGYKRSINSMLSAYEDLLEFLQSYTTPYFSMRYQGHMLWDNTLPALCGYFATMLHNPNNVSIQASSATTPLEILVGWDLCRMVGFTTPDTVAHCAPWAHITCDGSVANLEACWSGRELQYYPFALRRMLEEIDYFSFPDKNGTLQKVVIDNDQFPVTLSLADSTEAILTDANLDSWSLMNLSFDEIVSLPGKIASLYNIEDDYVIWSASIPYTLNFQGYHSMDRYIQTITPETTMPVLIAPVTMHYSLPKSAAVLGYGFGTGLSNKSTITGGQIIAIPVDEHGRMRIADLEKTLTHCLINNIPVAQVIAVVGTTEEGAVDDLSTILRLRDRFRKNGLNFFIHADCAWGGYMITAMRNRYTFTGMEDRNKKQDHTSKNEKDKTFITSDSSPFNSHVYRQMANIRNCDSVTIDPHKMGYVQYPAGAILYRNGIVRRLTTFTGTYIGGTGSIDPGPEPTVGIYGIEGSRAGAASAAVFLSHRVIRPDVTGHGKIIRQCMDNTKIFALYLLALGQQSKLYTISLLTPNVALPAELQPADILAMERNEILALLSSGKLRNFGPDLNILNYVCNPYNGDGTINKDPELLNRFNLMVYEQCHVPVSLQSGKKFPIPLEEFPKLFITMTRFQTAEYGNSFLSKTFSRLCSATVKTNNIPNDGLVCLRSVIMDPFMPFAENGDFFRTIANQFDSILSELVKKWRDGEMN